VAYVEARACAALLTAEGAVPLPPAASAGPGAPAGAGPEALQARCASALLRGMRLAQGAGQPWLAANGASEAWGVYTPALRARQFARLSAVFHPALEVLMALPAAAVPGRVMAAAGEAATRGSEHAHLLALLAAALGEVSEAEAGDLQVARERAALVDGNSGRVGRDAAAGLLAPLAGAAEAAEGALAHVAAAGGAVPQALVEAYARVQALRGAAVKLPKVGRLVCGSVGG
jgi:hypothetical protein